MYPLRAPVRGARPSGVRLRAADEAAAHERDTLRPPGTIPRRDPADSIDEILFRFECGDVEGALVAADALMDRIPVVIMDHDELRTEPLGYWELHLIAHVDAEATLLELFHDAEMPLAEAVRVACGLAERRILALR